MVQEEQEQFEGPGPEAYHRNALLAGRFLVQRCTGCTNHVFFPRVLCPHCGIVLSAWVDACGFGTVYSTTVIRRSARQGGDYNVALIDLDEGARMMSRVEGVSPDEVRIGQRVRAAIVRDGEEPVIVFGIVEE